MPHGIDDCAAQGMPDTLSIRGDGFACILPCLLIVYSGGFTFFEEPRDEIEWAQLHRTREACFFWRLKVIDLLVFSLICRVLILVISF
jgi:hypothetical protein